MRMLRRFVSVSFGEIRSMLDYGGLGLKNLEAMNEALLMEFV